MLNTIHTYAAMNAGESLVRYDYQAGELCADDVEIKVHYCGICHSDLSMINNDWGISQYPLVAGHEIVGEIIALGTAVKGLQIGQIVGVGWTGQSCQSCDHCIDGKSQLCKEALPTVLKMGGFADKVRTQWQWVIPLPSHLDFAKAGPLLCGGITVFQPLLQHNINAMHKVGVIGIGGLGHLALQFLKQWGCEVVAFSSNPAKYDEIYALGADRILDSTNEQALKAERQSLDLIISTVNVSLNWNAYMSLLKPEGKLHLVGAVLDPLNMHSFSLIDGNKTVAGSTTGSPAQLRKMIDFSARKQILPRVEMFPMSQINQAIQHLKEGKARYRIVLKNDF